MMRSHLFPLTCTLVLLCCGARAAQACRPAPGYVAPPKGPLTRGKAFSAFAAVGTVTAAGSLTTAWLLDSTDRFPVLGAGLGTVPGIALSSYILMPLPSGSGDCGDGTMHQDEFLRRAWIPGILGIIPSALAWWISDSSFDDSYSVSAHVRSGYQGISVVGRW